MAILIAAPLSVAIYLAYDAIAFPDEFFKAYRQGDLFWPATGGPSIATLAALQAVILLSGFLPSVFFKKYPWTGLAVGGLVSALLDSAFGWIFWDVQGMFSVRAGAFTFLVGGCGLLLTTRAVAPRIAFLSVAGLAYWVLLILGIRVLWLSQPTSPGFRGFSLALDWATLFLIWVPALPFIAAWAIVSRPRPAAAQAA